MFFILFFITSKGISVINWEFLTQLPKPVGEAGGGILNAIIGTLMLITISTLLSVPIGVFTGIFLSEYRKGRLVYLVRLSIETLQGIPSIVIGIIAYVWIVVLGGFFLGPLGRSGPRHDDVTRHYHRHRGDPETHSRFFERGFSGTGCLLSEDDPKSGASCRMSGIMTGILLSIGRVAGETAPLLFTAFGSPFMNFNILKPVNTLPLMIFNYATSPYPEWHKLAWGASFVLIVFVLGINLFTKLVTRRWKVQF